MIANSSVEVSFSVNVEVCVRQSTHADGEGKENGKGDVSFSTPPHSLSHAGVILESVCGTSCGTISYLKRSAKRCFARENKKTPPTAIVVPTTSFQDTALPKKNNRRNDHEHPLDGVEDAVT